MDRILVIGSPGSGKSTLARRLGETLALPIIHLDREYFLPGWVEPTREHWAEKVARLTREPCWVMDGHYGGTLAARLAAADAVVFLDFSPLLCTWRIVKRWIDYRGVVRDDDMAPGCAEQLDPEFVLYVLRFRRDKAPEIKARLASFPGAIFHVTKPGNASLVARELARSTPPNRI